MGPAFERLIAVGDGAVLWTSTSGVGPAIVYCHGGPGLWDYLTPLTSLLPDDRAAIRFEQRGCGRSTGGGPFTIAQAVEDLDHLRVALGVDRWVVLGHSWGAELALRYAARHPDRTAAVMYIAGVGAGDGFWADFLDERDRRLGDDRPRWETLGARVRTPAEEREWCLLQWQPDFSPSSNVAAHGRALWASRPPGVSINRQANRELWADRKTEDLLALAVGLTPPVTMIFGADDPRPWTASNSLYAALPHVERVILEGAGHAPWVEQPGMTRQVICDAPPPIW